MIADTLYSKYIKERLGHEIIENDSGFIVFKVNGKEVFIVDMYVRQGMRKNGLGSDLIKNLTGIATFHKAEVITANIHLFDKNANNTLMAALKVGFKVIQADQNILLIALNFTEEK